MVQTRRQTPEQTLQIGVASWLRAASIRPARFWFVPNGGNLSKAQAGAFNAMGLTSGVHDLHFVWRSDAFGARFGTIELKAPNARKDAQTTAQRHFGEDLFRLGHHTAEARSLDEVLQHLTAWGYPLRSHNDAIRYAVANNLRLYAYPGGLR